jgi:heme exporter protein A
MPEPSTPAAAPFAGTGLACRRGGRLVFSGLDFHLDPGAVLILTGANGSGKSSLLRLMAGLTPPWEGVLTWNAVPIGEDPAAHRARLHFIGHQDALKLALGAGEMLRFWAGMHETAAAVDGALARFRLERLVQSPCRLLSAGQRRRLTLARLVASPAALWLLDEPLTGLDAASIEDLYAAVAAHRAAGGIIVLSTHAPLALSGTTTLSLDEFQPRQRYEAALT